MQNYATPLVLLPLSLRSGIEGASSDSDSDEDESDSEEQEMSEKSPMSGRQLLSGAGRRWLPRGYA